MNCYISTAQNYWMLNIRMVNEYMNGSLDLLYGSNELTVHNALSEVFGAYQAFDKQWPNPCLYFILFISGKGQRSPIKYWGGDSYLRCLILTVMSMKGKDKDSEFSSIIQGHAFSYISWISFTPSLHSFPFSCTLLSPTCHFCSYSRFYQE